MSWTCSASLALWVLFFCGCIGSCGDASLETPHLAPAAYPLARVNGQVLSQAQRTQFLQTYGLEPEAGDYWYDQRSGLFGALGGPAEGFLWPGHELGAMSKAASGGKTQVCLNGRRLPRAELDGLERLFGSAVPAGRYWLDALGNYGLETQSQPMGNLLKFAGARAGLEQGAGIWSTRFSAGNSNAAGTRGYVSVPGHGPVSFGM